MNLIKQTIKSPGLWAFVAVLYVTRDMTMPAPIVLAFIAGLFLPTGVWLLFNLDKMAELYQLLLFKRSTQTLEQRLDAEKQRIKNVRKNK